MTEVIRYEHVDISYKGKRVVHDVSFSVEKGEILGIVGESGSGKSTLIKAAMGLLSQEGLVTRGDIWYQGKNITDLPGRDRRRLNGPELGYIFQNAGSSFSPIRTVGVQLYETMKEHSRISKKEFQDRALELLAKLGFSDGMRILKSYPFELSGGMQQRVGIARALAIQPEILLMDEPFDNMSVTARRKMIGILLTLHEKGTSIILNTPMYPEMMGFITDVLVMESGKNLTFGPVEEVYAEALCKSPVRMHILAQMEKALEVLKENPLVDRVTVDGDDVIFRFNGGEKEEAELLTDLVASGALIHNYMRDQADIEEIFRR